MRDRGLTDWRDCVERIDAGHERVFDLAQRVPAERRETAGACGVWNVRQLLAHLEAWNVEILGNLRQLKEGDEEITEHDVDAFNRRAVQAREGWSWATVLTRLRTSQRDLRSHLSSCAAEGRSLTPDEREWIEVLVSHDQHHAAQLEQWIRSDRRSEGPHGV